MGLLVIGVVVGVFIPNHFGLISITFIFLILLECFSLLLSVVLNVFHLIVLILNTSLFTGNLRFCLRVLAVIDIAGGSLCHGINIIYYFNRTMIKTSLVKCNVAVGFCILLVLFSQLTLFVITIDRYIAVTRPLQYYNILTLRRIRIFLLAVLMFGFSMSVGRSVHGFAIGHCDFDGDNLFMRKGTRALTIYNIMPLILVMVTTILNARLLFIARAHKRRCQVTRQLNIALTSRDSAEAHDTEQNIFSERYKSAITISAVVGASYLVWMPYLIITIVILSTQSNLSPVGKVTTYWLIYTTFWLNPIVLGLVNRSYKNAAIRLTRKMRHPHNSVP